jgi:hypothetical protein
MHHPLYYLLLFFCANQTGCKTGKRNAILWRIGEESTPRRKAGQEKKNDHKGRMHSKETFEGEGEIHNLLCNAMHVIKRIDYTGNTLEATKVILCALRTLMHVLLVSACG